MARETDNDRCEICHNLLVRQDGDCGRVCPECKDAVSNVLEECGLSDEHFDRVVAFVTMMIERAHHMEVTIRVPTYYGHAYPDAVHDGLVPEFGRPFVGIRVQRAEGLRLVLGTSDPLGQEPGIQIERRPNGWALFLHPQCGGDPSGYVYFIDDGRSFVVPDCGVTTPAIQICESKNVLAAVDRKKRI